MNAVDPAGIAAAYDALAGRLPGLAAAAPITFCGMSACVDARIDMARMEPLLGAAEPSEAAAFAAMLKQRAARGVGGEVRVAWPDGPAWLAARLDLRYALGGVGPQAGWVLATLGAPALVNLEDRSRHMLDRLPASMLLAEEGGAVRAADMSPRGTRRPDIFIFEYTAGVAVGDVVPARSSRIIVRFNDPGLERDGAFEALTVRLSPDAGAGLVSGFNTVPLGQLEGELDRVFGLTRRWRAVGLSTVHLEKSGYDSPVARDRVLEASRGAVTSLGMSYSEFRDLCAPAGTGEELAAAMIALGERLALERVCVHADHWAAGATRGDPDVEREALMAGCLLASARSAAGLPIMPDGVPADARFHEPPFGSVEHRGAWSLVAVPSPFLAAPATTLGLGDTFTGGCLLILGSASGRQPRPRAEWPG